MNGGERSRHPESPPTQRTTGDRKRSPSTGSEILGARPPAAAAERRHGTAGSASTDGLPLDAPTRVAMEAGFGHDFSAVRVHADERAGDAARALGARAFTVGTHVVFARGAYLPRTPAGRRLIAHELAHVVQQAGRAPVGRVPDYSGDRAAEDAARTVASGGRAHVSPLAAGGPQCSPDPPPGGGPTRSPALTPEEMWKLVQAKRGFESSSSGAGDAYRSSPARVPPGSLRVDEAGNPVAKGAPLGKGYETFAALQLVDADGNRVTLAVDSFGGAGADDHAEARGVRALEKHGPARLPGGKLVVVSDQAICGSCRQRLVDYARSRGLTVIEPHEPVRATMRGTGEASPKTTSRSSTQAGRPQLRVVARPAIPVPAPAPPTPQGGAPKAAPPPAPAPQQPSVAQRSRPAEATSTPAPRATPASPAQAPRERGVVTRGRVSVEVDVSTRRPTARVTAIDASGLAKDAAPHLSSTPKGSALATGTSAASIGRTLLDLYASSADEATRTTIEKVTHPVESRLRAMIFEAEKEFLATHPDPATLASTIDAERLGAVYHAEWRRLGAHRTRATLAMIALVMVPEDQRGPDWFAALERARSGAAAPPRDVQSFRAAAQAYESRAIDALQEVARYPLGLPQLAAEIDQRAQILGAIADELEETFWEAATAFPFASTVLLELYSKSHFVAGLSARMAGFASTVRSRYRAYVELDERLSARLRQVGEHIDDPGKAIMQAPLAARTWSR